jgi:DNA-binding beta-propeller fold protein YncE
MTPLLLLLLFPAAGSFPLFESGPVRPLALSPDRALLYALNIPAGRLEVFRALEGDGVLARAGETRVGLEPVAVAVAPDGRLWVVNHLSDSISVVDASDPARPFVRATLQVGDEPRDIVFAGPGRRKAFITAARRGQSRPGGAELTRAGIGRADVWVFDTFDLEAAPHIITLFADTPRGLAASPDGRTVYAAAFHSGNRTSAVDLFAAAPHGDMNFKIGDGFHPPGALPLPLDLPDVSGAAPPETAVLVRFDGERWQDEAGRDWTPRVRFSLPDKDLFAIDALRDPPAETAFASGAGTILFNLAVEPRSGKVYVSGLESHNLRRFLPRLRGRFVANRLAIVDFSSRPAAVETVDLNPHLEARRRQARSAAKQPENEAAAEAAAQREIEDFEQSLALPLALEFSPGGERLYLAAFGSRRVAVLDPSGRIVARIAVGGGPAGLALDAARERLYVLNRFDRTLSVVDTARGKEVAVVPLGYDPEPAAVRAGREHLYDGRTSERGDAACASCHIFADTDGLAWDLGDPGAPLEENPLPRVAIQGDEPLRPFHPLKGPMATLSLRGLAGQGSMHWRGDRNGGRDDPLNDRKAFLSFRPAFQELLGRREELPRQAMEELADFVLAIRQPPNPIARLDGTLTPEEAFGREIFFSSGSRTGLGGDGVPCAGCHALPAGGDGRGAFVALPQEFKVPQLRALYAKVGMFGFALPDIERETPFVLARAPAPHLGDQVRGFGFLHAGATPALFNFFRRMTQDFTLPDEPGQPGRSGDAKARALEAFMLVWPTGLAPVVGQQVTLDARNLAAGREHRRRYELLRDRALAGDAELAAHGLFRGEARGFFLDLEGGAFQSDRRAQRLDEAELFQALAEGEAILTFTAAPPGAGRRMGIDRDEDGALDQDEIDAGSDPADPRSLPAAREEGAPREPPPSSGSRRTP